MTEDGHDIIDCVTWVDVGVRPGGDDLLDCVADYDNGDLTGGFIQKA
jgi:hypothetical protein